ncbi:uncharacterized protein LOC108677977 [Hyalella azteca]|uniref:Uncharacterized protein LOC108677977 n=1 Tax=Hyalella azteca TaxID=294128 RepID=A0A8B7P744_HYAAZ|nr:uncharacterized protein LOC108677977 [Hyalella azteca]
MKVTLILALACAAVTIAVPSAIPDSWKMQQCMLTMVPVSSREEFGKALIACFQEHFATNGSRPGPIVVEDLPEVQVCLSKKLGYVMENGTFDVEAFKSQIALNVAGSDDEANFKLGLDNCPTDALANNSLILEYMGCLATYCATGAGPQPLPATRTSYHSRTQGLQSNFFTKFDAFFS